MNERTLYQTLAEAPDDEGHCVVFADWLLERGDPMAEFLALQLEHQKKPLDKLRAQRAQDLLIMNWRRWSGELNRVLHRRACTFERGFLRVAEARVTERTSLDSITDAPQWATVRQLAITGPAVQVARVLESPWLKNLRHLTCPAEALAQVSSLSFRLHTLALTGKGAETVNSNPAWNQLSRLTLNEFLDAETLRLTAREVNCSTATLDGAVSLISGWLAVRARPGVVLVDAQGSQLKFENERVEVITGAIDPREFRALRRLGALQLDVQWGSRNYRGPAKALSW
jgi:uncharacterized protein (TIGR02996 family)